MKIMKIIILFSLITLFSCKSDEELISEFSKEIINGIKNKDSEKIYSLFISPEETALYGFLDGSVSSDEMSNLKSSDELVELIIQKGTKNKPNEIKYINESIAYFHTLFDWKKVKYVKTESVLVESKKVSNMKNKLKVDSDIYDLKIIVELNDKKVYSLKINKAMKLNGRWGIFPLHSFGIEIEE